MRSYLLTSALRFPVDQWRQSCAWKQPKTRVIEDSQMRGPTLPIQHRHQRARQHREWHRRWRSLEIRCRVSQTLPKNKQNDTADVTCCYLWAPIGKVKRVSSFSLGTKDYSTATHYLSHQVLQRKDLPFWYNQHWLEDLLVWPLRRAELYAHRRMSHMPICEWIESFWPVQAKAETSMAFIGGGGEWGRDNGSVRVKTEYERHIAVQEPQTYGCNTVWGHEDLLWRGGKISDCLPRYICHQKEIMHLPSEWRCDPHELWPNLQLLKAWLYRVSCRLFIVSMDVIKALRRKDIHSHVERQVTSAFGVR